MTVKISKPAINVREELADLRKPTGVAGEAMLRAETPQEQFNLIGAGRRNLLINGGFDVWQRGTSMSNPSGTHYLADRVQFYGGGRSDSLIARSTDVPTGERFKYSMAVTATQAHSLPFYRQKIEDFTTVVSNTHAWAMSFWAKASVPMTISSDLGDKADQEHFLTTSWQRFTNIVPAGTAFTFDAFDLQGNSSAGIIYVTGCQLEVGSVATDFEYRSYGEELALCQRYYTEIKQFVFNANKGTDSHWDGHVNAGSYPFPVTMRTSPSLTIVQTFGWIANTNGWTTPSAGRHPVGIGITNEQNVNFTAVNYWDVSGTSGSSAGSTTAVRIEKAIANAEM
jgi:hypothetical protein